MKEVYEAFGLDCREALPNRNALQVNTDQGIKCLKEKKFRSNEFEFIFSALDYLKQRGFSYIPEYKKTLDGQLYYRKEDKIYILCDWIESRHADFTNPKELIKVVQTLGGFHSASIGFQFDALPEHKMVYGRWIEKFSKRCGEIQQFLKAAEEKEEKTYFDQLYMQHGQECYEQGCAAIELLKKSGYEQYSMEKKRVGGFCHHDTAHHNFLMTPEEQCYMIDFDYCICDVHLHDLCSIIIRNNKHLYWDIAKAYFILEVYKKLIPVTDEELEIMRGFIAFPQDFWQVGLQYYVENQPWELDTFIQRLKRFIKRKEDRKAFITHFLEVLTKM